MVAGILISLPIVGPTCSLFFLVPFMLNRWQIFVSWDCGPVYMCNFLNLKFEHTKDGHLRCLGLKWLAFVMAPYSDVLGLFPLWFFCYSLFFWVFLLWKMRNFNWYHCKWQTWAWNENTLNYLIDLVEFWAQLIMLYWNRTKVVEILIWPVSHCKTQIIECPILQISGAS